jgi:hypothetical protein
LNALKRKIDDESCKHHQETNALKEQISKLEEKMNQTLKEENQKHEQQALAQAAQLKDQLSTQHQEILQILRSKP